ncbi:MAG: ABC transporter permease [Spirochaetota bacterium]
MSSLRFAGTKVARSLLTMLVVLVFVFVILRVTGDPAELMLPDDATEQQIAALRARWGLDEPLPVQFAIYVRAVLSGDFGTSFRTRLPVMQMIAQAFPRTVLLMSVSIVFSFALAIPTGVCAAIRRGSFADQAIMGLAVFGFSMPDFFFGILLLFLFSLRLGWLPAAGSESAAHLVMPVLTLGTSSIGSFARFTRSAMLQTLGSGYIRTVVAQGVPWRRILYRHALPNAAIPIVTLLGTSIGGIVTGSVVVETVFGWPGLGRLLVRSVGYRDLPVVQGLVIIMACSIIVAHLFVDVLYSALVPGIRIGGDR